MAESQVTVTGAQSIVIRTPAEVGPAGPQGLRGLRGPVGADGPQGPAGPGVPAGGTTGQVLAKASGTDYDGEWVDPAGGSGGGDIVLLQTIEITSPVAAVDITGLNLYDYSYCLVYFVGLRSLNSGIFDWHHILCSDDDGSTYHTTGYAGEVQASGINNSDQLDSGNSSEFKFAVGPRSYHGFISVSPMHLCSEKGGVIGMDSGIYPNIIAYSYGSNPAGVSTNAMRISHASGLDAGTIKVYGVR